MNILAVSGSLRAVSSNTALLKAAARLAPDGIAITLYADLGALPLFNPDLEDTLPAIVRALRQAVGNADGLLISSPEYAHGIASPMKNALDWLVASVAFPGKPVALLQATQRAVHADAQLREILTTMSARLVEAACVALPVSGRPPEAPDIADDPVLAGPLGAALDAFVSAIRKIGEAPARDLSAPGATDAR